MKSLLPNKQIFVALVTYSAGCILQQTPNVRRAFKDSQIVPDVLDESPEKLLRVLYPKAGVEVFLGNKIAPDAMREEPQIVYQTEPNEYYTIMMTDPDSPTGEEVKPKGEYNHWLVCNIPGSQYINNGNVLKEYFGPAPEKATGIHRYVLLLFKQPGIINPDEPKVTSTSGSRENFSAKAFASKYELSVVAGNFFTAQFDKFVPESL